MGYIIGFSAGQYSWPSMPQNGNPNLVGKTLLTKTWKDTMEQVHTLAEFRRDLMEIRDIALNNNATDILSPKPEIIVGRTCQRCYNNVVFTLLGLDDITTIDIHQCDPEKVKVLPHEDSLIQELYHKVNQKLPEFIIFAVNDWLKGQKKYIRAVELGSPNLSTQYIKEVRLDEDDICGYLSNAISGAKEMTPVQISDDDLRHFIERASGTAMVAEINDGEQTPLYYYISIVPPHQISAIEQQVRIGNLQQDLPPRWFEDNRNYGAPATTRRTFDLSPEKD